MRTSRHQTARPAPLGHRLTGHESTVDDPDLVGDLCPGQPDRADVLDRSCSRWP